MTMPENRSRQSLEADPLDVEVVFVRCCIVPLLEPELFIYVCPVQSKQQVTDRTKTQRRRRRAGKGAALGTPGTPLNALTAAETCSRRSHNGTQSAQSRDSLADTVTVSLLEQDRTQSCSWTWFS
ncbi:uncharacterized protein V6R79_016412 [Siganus canaliculatus]